MKNIVIFPTEAKTSFGHNFVTALARTVAYGKDNEVTFHFDPGVLGNSHELEKNVVLNRVLSSNIVDGVVFLNPGLSWFPEDLIKLVNADEDAVVSGVYPEPVIQEETYAVVLDHEKVDEWASYLPALEVPVAFTYIPKKVLQGLTPFVNKAGDESEDFYFFFSSSIKDGKYRTDSSNFCQSVRDAGFQLLVDPKINAVNHSKIAFQADYQKAVAKQWLNKKEENIALNPEA